MCNQKVVGKISYWNEKRGFGFVVAVDPSADKLVKVFLHVNYFTNLGINEIPQVGQEAKFRIGKNDKGLLAEEVELISADKPTGSSSNAEATENVSH